MMATHYHLLYWILILQGLINSGVFGERCLSCNEVIAPRHCKVAVECRQNEICYTQKYTDITGEVLYNVGCLDNGTCASSIGNTVPIQTYIGQHQHNIMSVSCQQCCEGKACNLNGCGAKSYPGDKGLLCFQCKQRRNSSSCVNFQECYGKDAHCFVENLEEYGDNFYQHGCSSEKHCSSTFQTAGNPLNIFGKKRQVRGAILLNRTCCDSDFCNDGKNNTSATVTEPKVVNHFGKEFFLSFPSLSNNTDKIEVMLTGISDATVTFISHVMGVNRTVLVPATTGLSVFLPADVLYFDNSTKTAITYKTVKVVSNKDISIFVVIYEKALTSDGYLAIPKKTLGKRYSFIFDKGLVAITATTDNTNLNINMTSLSVNNSSKTHYDFIISKLQTLYLYIKEDDAVFGSVEASSDINVVFASEPSFIDSALPLQFPTTYVLYTLGNAVNSFLCTTDPSEDGNNDIHFSVDPVVNNTYWYGLYTSRTDAFYNFTSSVTVSTKGEMSCLSALQEALVSLQPIASFTNNYLFKTPTSTNYTHSASLLTQKQYQGDILDNGKPLIINDHYEVQFNNTEYTVLMLNITDGLHHIGNANRNAKFGLVLYGYDDSSTVVYAYPAGLECVK